MVAIPQTPPMALVEKSILERISTGKYSVWATSDFVGIAPPAILDLALSRLNASEQLTRVAKGLYYKPRINKLTGRLSVADPSGVIDAIARRGSLRYIVDGMTAANDLGWETAVPAHYTVYTDKRLQPVQMGNLVITFKPVVSTRLAWAGNPAMRVVQALYYFEDKIDRDREILHEKLSRLLADPIHGQPIRDGLKEGVHSLPRWMQEFLIPHLFISKDNATDSEEDAAPGLKP